MLGNAMRTATSQLSTIHLQHGGGGGGGGGGSGVAEEEAHATGGSPNEQPSLGVSGEQCSAMAHDWTWSCVVTALWWEYNGKADDRQKQWVFAVVSELIEDPSTTGVYSTDLGQCAKYPPLATDNLLENTDGVLRPIIVLSGRHPATFCLC